MKIQQDNIAVFFDIDFTITRKDTFRSFLEFWYMKNRDNWRYLPLVFFIGVLRKARFISLSKFKELSLFSLKGKSKNDIENIGKQFFNQVAKHIIFQSALKAIKLYRQKRYSVFLISSSPDIYNKAISKYVMADNYYCTKLEYVNGFTGRINGFDCYGPEKVKIISELIDHSNSKFDLAKSIAYSDSFSDLPLLQSVGYPIAVNPDKRLLKYAIQNNWKIERWQD